MTIDPLLEIKKVYIEFHVNVEMALLDQIIKSPEIITETNQLAPAEIDNIKKNQKEISEKALKFESDYLISKNKIKTENQLFDLIESMSDIKIMNLRKKFLVQSINSFVQNG
ncbi:MAG: hypothetical protein AABX11_04785 [Nanoarchaeota archaeon]